MNEARVVNRLQSGQELRGDLASLFQLERASLGENLPQGLAFDVFHRDQLAILQLVEIEDPADVGRDHLARRAHLAPQELERPLVIDQVVAQPFERDVEPELQIVRSPDLAHPAATEEGLDTIALAGDRPVAQGGEDAFVTRRAGVGREELGAPARELASHTVERTGPVVGFEQRAHRALELGVAVAASSDEGLPVGQWLVEGREEDPLRCPLELVLSAAGVVLRAHRRTFGRRIGRTLRGSGLDVGQKLVKALSSDRPVVTPQRS
jgi:hypothetical protein